MIRSILVGLGVALLSWVLLVLFTIGWLSWTRSGRMLRNGDLTKQDYATVEGKYGDPFVLLSQAKSGQELVILPLISIVAGLAVGLASRTRAGWTTVAGLLPLQAFLVAADSFAALAFARAAAYLALGFLSATGLQRLRRKALPRTIAQR